MRFRYYNGQMYVDTRNERQIYRAKMEAMPARSKNIMLLGLILLIVVPFIIASMCY